MEETRIKSGVLTASLIPSGEWKRPVPGGYGEYGDLTASLIPSGEWKLGEILAMNRDKITDSFFNSLRGMETRPEISPGEKPTQLTASLIPSGEWKH